jgi:hypothetical protein
MSDEPWQKLVNPEQLLVYLQKQGHDPAGRKLRLVAVACCRRVWDLLPEPQRSAVEVAERVAEGDALTEDEWNELADRVEDGEGFEVRGPIAEAVTSAIYASFIDFRIHRVFGGCAGALAWSGALARRPHLAQRPERLRDLARSPDVLEVGLQEELAASFRHHLQDQCPLVIDVFGHLLHEVAVLPAALTPPVVGLARAIYDERRFTDLPILADALEEAGVTDPSILGHCRSAGPHFRGCWVLDLLLGKA